MAGLHPTAVDTVDELLTQQQAAELLKVTVPTVRSMIDRSVLRAYRVGPRAVRIRRSDLDSILTPIESDAGCNSGWRIAFRDGGSWRIRQLRCKLVRRGSGAPEAANWFIDFGTVCSSGAWLVVGSRACKPAFGVEQ
jgi:excisionase family DNA binding protein